MKDISNLFQNLNRYMIEFIFSFIIGDVAVVIISSVIVWVFFEQFLEGAKIFSSITLVALFVTSILSKRYSYLLDKYSRVKAVIMSNIMMILLVMLIIFINYKEGSLASAVIVYGWGLFAINIYFSVFYPARSALAQAIIEDNRQKNSNLTFKQLNSILVITDKFGGIVAGLVVAGLFKTLSINGLMLISLAMLVISNLLLIKFQEPGKLIKTNDSNETPNEIGFQWYFSHSIAWVVTIAVFINIIIMLNNTIKPIYLYDVLQITPEMMAYIGISFNIGALLGGTLVNFIQSEKRSIYIFFLIGLVTTFMIALLPSFEMFVITSAVLGFCGNANRVMFSSLIMQNINTQVATFFGLQSSIIKAIQFLALLGVNVFMMVNGEIYNLGSELVIWFYPAIFLLVPVVLIWSKVLDSEHDLKKSNMKITRMDSLYSLGNGVCKLRIQHSDNLQKSKYVEKYFIEYCTHF